MIEQEKKGSPWPWFLVPIAAVSLFFVLRECRRTLPAAESATPAVAVPSEPKPSDPETAPVTEPAPQ